MKRPIVLTMVAGLMSFGALAGQTNKPVAKPAPPATTASSAPTTATPPAAEHGHGQKAKKHESKKQHKKSNAPATMPKN